MKLLPLLFFLPLLAAQTRPPTMDEVGRTNLPQQSIGASDLIAVSVYDAPELTRTVRVESDGVIRLPLLKKSIDAAGLLPRDLETSIGEALKEEEIMVDPIVKVTVVEYYSRPIAVAGAVRKPLIFQATGNVTLLEALSRAEGLSPDAGQEILVSRAGELVHRIPVRALIDAADPAANLRLDGGEEIRVPEAAKIYVVGNVKKPGAFPMRDGAETSVLKLLALAEGLAPYSAKLAYIYRRDPDAASKKEMEIELDKIMKRKSPDVPLTADDILYIPDNTGRRATASAIEKVLLLGGTIGAAGVYGAAVRR
jgi:polysaccharide export outer membrane protein